MTEQEQRNEYTNTILKIQTLIDSFKTETIKKDDEKTLLNELNNLFNSYKELENSEYSIPIYLQTKYFIKSLDITPLEPSLRELWFYPLIKNIKGDR